MLQTFKFMVYFFVKNAPSEALKYPSVNAQRKWLQDRLVNEIEKKRRQRLKANRIKISQVRYVIILKQWIQSSSSQSVGAYTQYNLERRKTDGQTW